MHDLKARSQGPIRLNSTQPVKLNRIGRSDHSYNSTELNLFQLVRASFASSEHFTAGRVESSWVVDMITSPESTKLN